MSTGLSRRGFLGAVGAAGAADVAATADAGRRVQASDATAPDVAWTRTYGGRPSDSAAAALQGGPSVYLFAGTTASSGAGGFDGWLVAVDRDGGVQWERTYGGSGTDAVWTLVEGHDGGVLLAGQTDAAADDQRGWLVKVDDDGREEWDRTYGDAAELPQVLAAVGTDDGYVLAGGQVRDGSQQGWVVAVDSEGRTRWERRFGGAENDVLFDVTATPDGGVLLVGQADSSNVASGDAWLVKLDDEGRMEWERTYGGGNADVARASVAARGGGYLVAGSRVGEGNDQSDGWLLKVDDRGDREWERTYGGDRIDFLTCIEAAHDGGYVLAGRTASTDDGRQDTWLVKVDDDGNEEWAGTYGTDVPQDAHALVKVEDGAYLLAGHQEGPANTDEGHDAWLVKTEPFGGGVADTGLLVLLGGVAVLGVLAVLAVVALVVAVAGIWWIRRSSGGGADERADDGTDGEDGGNDLNGEN